MPLFGESTTHEQRREQVAALSSLIINGSAAARSSSSGPVKRTRSTKAKDGRSRSLSQGRPSSASTSKPAAVAAAAPRGGRRLSDDAHMVVESSTSTTPPRPSARSTSPGHSPTRSWLDALREAEARAKLKRLQHAAAAGSATSGSTRGVPRGRLALMHGQLLAQSMEAETLGVPAAALPPATGGGLTVFPWGRA